MAAPSTEDRGRPRRGVVVALGLVIVAGAVLGAVVLADGPDRAVVRSAVPAAEGEDAGVAVVPEEPTSTTTAPTSTTSSTTTTSTSTTTTPTTTTMTTTTASPTTTTAAPPAPPATEAPAPTTGALALELAPPEDGWSKHVQVSAPDGSTVLPSTPVTGPIVLEGLAPGTYDVVLSQQGPPYGPDENGVELGGGSQVVRLPADVTAGETTTVPDPRM